MGFLLQPGRFLYGGADCYAVAVRHISNVARQNELDFRDELIRFDVPSGSDFFQSHFAAFDANLLALLIGLAASFALSSGMAALGLVWAGWLKRVQR